MKLFSRILLQSKRYILRNTATLSKQNGFGICVDIDGVLLRGKKPIPGAEDAMKMLTDGTGCFKYPVVFLTNSSRTENDKAREISEIFGVQALPDQFVMAPSPLRLFTNYHKKRCLFLGQDDIITMAKALGFTNACTIQDVADAFPLLDMVSQRKRPTIEILSEKLLSDKAATWEPLEAIVLFTTPLQWEMVLQLTTDLLLTRGDPRQAVMKHESQLPIIVCNPDLQFMHASHIPRFGHGSFVICLETLYKKLSGRELVYEVILGKPSEVSFRYAEHRLHQLRRALKLDRAFSTMYMIGDNQQVDIVGANLYGKYLKEIRNTRNTSIPKSRQLESEELGQQTVSSVFSYLVGTGVYEPHKHSHDTEDINHSHRDFRTTQDLLVPDKISKNLFDAICDILNREK